jgi:hypothetical protein
LVRNLIQKVFSLLVEKRNKSHISNEYIFSTYGIKSDQVLQKNSQLAVIGLKKLGFLSWDDKVIIPPKGLKKIKINLLKRY